MCACWAFVHARSRIKVPIWDSVICGCVCVCRQTNSEARSAALTTPTTHSPLLSGTLRTLWRMPGHAASGSGRAIAAKAIPSTFWTRTATSSKPMSVRWRAACGPMRACGFSTEPTSRQRRRYSGKTRCKSLFDTAALQEVLPVDTGEPAWLRHTRRSAAPLPLPPHCPPSHHSALPRACAA